jgi:hypothetical protein
MEERKQDETGKTEYVEKTGTTEQSNAVVSVMSYDVPGLLVGSEKRKQEAAEKENDAPAAMTDNQDKRVKSEDLSKMRTKDFADWQAGWFAVRYGYIKPLLELAKAFKTPKIMLEFKTDGLHTRFVDPAHVAMISAFISRGNFELYARRDEKDIEFGVDSEMIIQLKLEAKKEFVEIIPKYNKFNVRKDRIDSYEVRQGHKDTEFMAENESAYKPMVVNLTHTSSVSMPIGKVMNFFRAIDKFSNGFKITLTREEGVVLENRDREVTIQTVVPANETTIGLNEPKIWAVFPSDYVVNAFKCLKNAKNIKMGWQNDRPIQIDFFMETGNSVVSLLVAPRVAD